MTDLMRVAWQTTPIQRATEEGVDGDLLTMIRVSMFTRKR